MLNRFKLVLLNAVSGNDALPGTENALEEGKPTPKFPYSRPHFLQFNVDELSVSADKSSRPIIVPRKLLPWNTGYAETVNAGKSRYNEDQACIYKGVIEYPDESQDPTLGLPFVYFGLFDGHAGTGAAVAAAKQLHVILQQKLTEVLEHLLPRLDESKTNKSIFGEHKVAEDTVVVGALETAFEEMDKKIGEDKLKYELKGGCTALVALFILGKLYVANAGDSRAIFCTANSQPTALSKDFTPERERLRIRKLALLKPELTNGLYTPLEFQKRPRSEDLGKRVLYRNPLMKGWGLKTVTQADLTPLVVSGEMKRSRVLQTIGVTRGFGDHELKAISTNVPIKPFLLAMPEVTTLRLGDQIDKTSVLVMGTDGLWDVVSNHKVSDIVQKDLNNQTLTDKYRLTVAAQDLVQSSRGKSTDTRGWRLDDGGCGTSDDISVFVIPLLPYKEEHKAWKQQYEALKGLFEIGNEAEEDFGNLFLETSPEHTGTANNPDAEGEEDEVIDVE